MDIVRSPAQIGREEVLLEIWNSSAHQSVLIRGDSQVCTYAPQDAALSVILPPHKSILISTLEGMETEDDAGVSWIATSHPLEPENCQVFLLLREREWGARLVAAALPDGGPSSFAMFWDSTSRVDGLAPFRRVVNFVLVPHAASCTPSPLAVRFREWISGQTWPAPSSPTSTASTLTPVSEQAPA